MARRPVRLPHSPNHLVILSLFPPWCIPDIVRRETEADITGRSQFATMNYPSPILPRADGVTTIYPPEGPHSGRRPPRCRVAMALAGGSAFRGAVECLLHRRLFFVALLT